MTKAGGYYLLIVLALWAMGFSYPVVVCGFTGAAAFIEIRLRYDAKLSHKFRAMACAILGHSHLVTNCMCYKYCARCGDQV